MLCCPRRSPPSFSNRLPGGTRRSFKSFALSSICSFRSACAWNERNFRGESQTGLLALAFASASLSRRCWRPAGFRRRSSATTKRRTTGSFFVSGQRYRIISWPAPDQQARRLRAHVGGTAIDLHRHRGSRATSCQAIELPRRGHLLDPEQDPHHDVARQEGSESRRHFFEVLARQQPRRPCRAQHGSSAARAGLRPCSLIEAATAGERFDSEMPRRKTARTAGSVSSRSSVTPYEAQRLPQARPVRGRREIRGKAHALAAPGYARREHLLLVAHQRVELALRDAGRGSRSRAWSRRRSRAP